MGLSFLLHLSLFHLSGVSLRFPSSFSPFASFIYWHCIPSIRARQSHLASFTTLLWHPSSTGTAYHLVGNALDSPPPHSVQPSSTGTAHFPSWPDSHIWPPSLPLPRHPLSTGTAFYLAGITLDFPPPYSVPPPSTGTSSPFSLSGIRSRPPSLPFSLHPSLQDLHISTPNSG